MSTLHTSRTITTATALFCNVDNHHFQSAAARGPSAAPAASCADDVLAVIRGPLGTARDRGMHVNEVVTQLNDCYAVAEVRWVIARLVDDDRLYSTIDNDHFTFTRD